MERRTRCSRINKKDAVEFLDDHEGLSLNQVKIIIREFNLSYDEFSGWIGGQTCPVLIRPNEKGRAITLPGIFEYDLFRWIRNKKKGEPLIWD